MTETDKRPPDPAKTSDTWHTVIEACHILGISRRTLERRIKAAEVESELRDGIRYVKLDIDADVTQDLTQRLSQLEADKARLITEVDELKADNRKLEAKLETKDEQLRAKDEYLQTELKRKDEQAQQEKERDQMIILQLTRQLEQSQRLLEYHQDPWWRRWWFKRKREENRS